MRNTNTPVALESIPFIVAGIAAAALFLALGFIVPMIISFLFVGFTLFFFRNPDRNVPRIPDSVIAPADGTIIYSGMATDEATLQEMHKLSIFMSVFNVHINRAPVTGTVTGTFYRRGKFLDVRDERATFENERKGLVIETEKGQRVTVVQVAGLIARRIVCYAAEGSRLVQGSRYGLIRFGSRLDVYLPADSDIKVAVGDRTTAGETVLGILK